MEDQPHHIAILFFSRSAPKEAVEKPWLPANQIKANKAIAQLLIGHTKKILAEAPFPVFHFTELEQKGNSFGERFSNAFQHLFSQGFEAVIAVGNDAPRLQQIDWQGVKTALQQQKAVIGPNLRGGNYLFALNHQNFNAEKLASLPWQSRFLEQAVECYFEPQSTGISYLSVYRDLNTLADLWAFLKEAKRGLKFLARLFSQLLLSLKALFTPTSLLRYPLHSPSAQCLRGPPHP